VNDHYYAHDHPDGQHKLKNGDALTQPNRSAGSADQASQCFGRSEKQTGQRRDKVRLEVIVMTQSQRDPAADFEPTGLQLNF
jgi:hypothetical protein